MSLATTRGKYCKRSLGRHGRGKFENHWSEHVVSIKMFDLEQKVITETLGSARTSYYVLKIPRIKHHWLEQVVQVSTRVYWSFVLSSS